MNSQELKQSKSQLQQTSTFSNVEVQGMLKSYPFVLQSKPNTRNLPDLKTSLMQAEKYGHHLNKTNLANQSATIAVQPKLNNQTVQLAKSKYPGHEAKDVSLGEEEAWKRLQKERNEKAQKNNKMANAAAYVHPESGMGQIHTETSGGSNVVNKQWDHARKTESAQDYLKRTGMTPQDVGNLHALAVVNPECGDGRVIGKALQDYDNYSRPTKHTLNTKEGRAKLMPNEGKNVSVSDDDDKDLRKKVGEEIPTEKPYPSIGQVLNNKGRVLDADGLRPCVPDDRNLRIQAGLEGIPIEVRYPSENKDTATMQSTRYEPNAKLGEDTKRRLYRGDEQQKNNDYEMMKKIHQNHKENLRTWRKLVPQSQIGEEQLNEQREKGDNSLDLDTSARLWAHRARIKSADHAYDKVSYKDKNNNDKEKRVDRFEYPK